MNGHCRSHKTTTSVKQRRNQRVPLVDAVRPREPQRWTQTGATRRRPSSVKVARHLVGQHEHDAVLVAENAHAVGQVEHRLGALGGVLPHATTTSQLRNTHCTSTTCKQVQTNKCKYRYRYRYKCKYRYRYRYKYKNRYRYKDERTSLAGRGDNSRDDRNVGRDTHTHTHM